MVFGGIQCPAVLEPGYIIPDALALTTAFLEARLRGSDGAEQHAMAWAARRPPEHLTMWIRNGAAAAAAA